MKTAFSLVFFLWYICFLQQNLFKIFSSFSRTLLKCFIFINRLKALGSRFFSSDSAIDIGMGCEIWQGYHQSARQGWKKVLLNINITSSAFLRGSSVLEYLYRITEYDVRENKGVLSDKNRMKFTANIKSML